MKIRLARFQIADIITLDEADINTVTRGFVAQNVLCPHRLQSVFQIHYQLTQISGVLCVVRIIGEQNGTYLPCGHSRALSIHEIGKQLFGLQSLEEMPNLDEDITNMTFDGESDMNNITFDELEE